MGFQWDFMDKSGDFIVFQWISWINHGFVVMLGAAKLGDFKNGI